MILKPSPFLPATFSFGFLPVPRVAQGGFAGASVVGEGVTTLEKFKGLEACPTWNFGGDSRSALAALAFPAIGRVRLVSKNVCHRAKFDSLLRDKLGAGLAAVSSDSDSDSDTDTDTDSRRQRAVRLFHAVMTRYLKRKGEKCLHDPLAAVAAVYPDVCAWAQVEVFQVPKEEDRRRPWGSRLADGTNTWISADVDLDSFFYHMALEGMPPAAVAAAQTWMPAAAAAAAGARTGARAGAGAGVRAGARAGAGAGAGAGAVAGAVAAGGTNAVAAAEADADADTDAAPQPTSTDAVGATATPTGVITTDGATA